MRARFSYLKRGVNLIKRVGIENVCWMEHLMNEEDLPLSEKLLLAIHNLCIVRPEIAKTSEEIAKVVNLGLNNVLEVLIGGK